MKKIESLPTALLRVLKLIKDRIRSPQDIVSNARKLLRALREGGFSQLTKDIESTTFVQKTKNNYTEWIEKYDTITPLKLEKYKANISRFQNTPEISVILPVYNPDPELLRQTLESIIEQVYPHWELCIANDASTDPQIKLLLDQYAAQNPKIKVVHRELNGHISAASNTALELSTFKWVALLDHDDVLPADALYQVAKSIIDNPQGLLFYSDEDKIDLGGNRHSPHFKPDFNKELFYSYNLISHLGIYNREKVLALKGFRMGLEGAQDYDLALRYIETISHDQIIHIPHVLYHWRTAPGSTALSSDEKPYAHIAGKTALKQHFERIKTSVTINELPYGYRVNYPLETSPLVSIIMPTRNSHELVKQAIESLWTITNYPNYELLLVDNGSDDKVSLEYFKTLHEHPNVKVVRDDAPFNYSALNNKAVAQCSGSILCLMNNDITAISPNWLSEMVSLAIQADVGAVGAMLYYPHNTVQHAGVIIGMGGVAGHANLGLKRGEHGYFYRASLRQDLSAVTAACLVVEKEKYLRVGGLDETNLKIAFNDVDFCLKLRAEGFRNIWTPYAEMYHHESASRGSEDTPEKVARFNKEIEHMQSKWSEILPNDPAYSPNLTLNFPDYSFAFPPRAVR